MSRWKHAGFILPLVIAFAALVASASGMPPTLAVEFGRKVLYPAHRPSFSELEQAMRGS